MQYQWIAAYNDNTTLAQYPSEGIENKYGDIDRSKLTQFVVVTVEPEPKPVLVLHLPEGSRLIYRQRVEKKESGEEIRIWLAGYQSTIEGKNSQFIAAIFEDGHIEVVDKWIDNSRWFYTPVLHPQEGETWEGI